MSDAFQTALLSTISVFIFVCLASWAVVERKLRIRSPNSTRFITANASTHLAAKVRRLVAAGVSITIPAGHGLYPLSLSEHGRRRWEAELTGWLNRGASVLVIVTSPNSRATDYWRTFTARMPAGLRVYFLDRRAALKEDAVEIARLDEFHPVLIAKDGEPLGLWVESLHPAESSVAYNVSYFSKEDIVGPQRQRFDRFLSLINRLVDGPAATCFASGSAAGGAKQMTRAA